MFFHSFADPSKARKKSNYMQCVFRNPYFYSKLSSGALIGVGDSYLNSKVYGVTVLNLKMGCNVRFRFHMGHRNRTLINKLFVECSISTRCRKKGPCMDRSILQL